MKISNNFLNDIFEDINKKYKINKNSNFKLVKIINNNYDEYKEILGIDDSNTINKVIKFNFDKNKYNLRVNNEILFFDSDDPNNVDISILNFLADTNILLLEFISNNINKKLNNIFNVFYNKYNKFSNNIIENQSDILDSILLKILLKIYC